MTNRCSNACDFCVRTECEKYYGDLWLEREPTKEEILNSILSRDLTKYENLVFCGFGEPTERFDDMIWIGREVRKVSPITRRVNTNGQANLINDRDVTPELEEAIDIVSVSLNAPTAEEYQAICHSKFGIAAFDAMLEFAQKAKRYVPTVILSVVDESIPDSDIEKCHAIADRIGVTLRVRDMIK